MAHGGYRPSAGRKQSRADPGVLTQRIENKLRFARTEQARRARLQSRHRIPPTRLRICKLPDDEAGGRHRIPERELVRILGLTTAQLHELARHARLPFSISTSSESIHPNISPRGALPRVLARGGRDQAGLRHTLQILTQTKTHQRASPVHRKG
jgi:hypothetical protein